MAQINMAVFTKDLREILDEVKFNTTRRIRKVVREVFEQVVEDSPVFSGYYASNHNVLIRAASGQFGIGGGRAGLTPGVRPVDAVRNQFADNIESNRSNQLAKVGSVQVGDVILIATEVPYANEVEQTHGVYAGVAAGFGLSVK